MAVSYADAKIEVEGLMERFARNLDVYKRADYKETQVRVEFIDPFFETLGWDVRNVQGYAEQYKDVIHEDAIKVGGATRAPDYCFRIGGVRKFFLEAKKPSVSVKGDVGPAYQLRRYAWSAKLPLSILTDFEEFAVYDCRQRPKPADKASAGRVMYLTFDQYLDRFDDIYGVFAKESVLKGSFDRYVQDAKRKRGTSEVDAEFLKEIEGWREVLARNIALRNPAVLVPELNFAVQRTIDRIIFLRMCEDRGIEDYARLLALTSGPHIYQRLGDLYRQADEKYNAGLFDFRADTLTKTLTIDDKVLKPILAGLYYPQSPYEFSVLPAEILGQVYEQFLGKVIRLTPSHRAKVEEKPEVKKAGGVYYTPTYIVDYIVQQTVGRLIEGKTPRQISKLRILDPACGSGSFLLGAYQYLLDYHRQWYEEHDPVKHARGKRPALYQAPTPSPSPPPLGPPQLWGGSGGGGWRLTSAEKKRILLNNIYGVDIDRQAVEVTKLSLLLKVLEGENQETLGQQLALWRERALPDLGNNIKCGNSLIGPDYFEAQLLPDEEEMRRVNPFDWEAEFAEAMAAGGFDAVIGNPPWGGSFSERELACLCASYQVTQGGTVDSYTVFIERALNCLKPNGLLSYITPDTFLRKDKHLQTRRLLLENASIVELIETGPVFSKVRDTWCLVFSVAKSEPDASTKTRHRKISRFVVSAEERLEKFGKGNWDTESEVSQLVWLQRPKMIIGYLASEAEQHLIAKIESYPALGQLSDRYRISRGEEGSKFALKEKPDGDFFIVIPKDVERYAVADGLRISGKALTSTKVVSLYEHPKIWIIRIQKMRWKQRIVCGLDERLNSAGMKTLQVVVSTNDSVEELKYLLAILTSSLMNFWCINYLADDMNKSYLERLPIRTIDFDDPEDAARHDKMVALVERMLELHKKLAAATIPADKELYRRQIEATDRQIDALVYELYGLSVEDIGIVERQS